MSESSTISGKRWHKSDSICLLLLVVIITLTWCGHYRRWSAGAWKTPVEYIGAREWDMTYAGDGLWGLAATKLMADGEISFWDKKPTSVGAPFGANWNDWPSIEEGVNNWWGLLAYIFGLGTGSNLAVLSAYLSAGATFYLVCHQLGYNRLFALAGAALFALSRFAFWRSLPNLSLTFYWHLPLGLLVAWWCARGLDVRDDRKKLVLCLLTPVFFAAQSPYYSGLFLQLLFWASLFAFVRSRRRQTLVLPSAIGAVLFATLFVVNLDTVFSHAERGFNTGVVHRSYSDLEKYALKPVELVLPRSHSWAALQEWTNANYFTKTFVTGEIGSAYLGIVAAISGLILAIVAARRISDSKAERLPIHFWGVCLILGFCVIGGLNGVVGLWGIWLFRASNRYSIALLAVLLLFLVKWLTAISRDRSSRTKAIVMSAILFLGIYDQVPPGYAARESAAQDLFRNDRQLVQKFEAKLPSDSMIFQVPVFPFPEGTLEEPMPGTMDDYEQFRPFIHSQGTRYSYGGTKGRYENRWQKEAERMGPEALVRALEAYGFAAVLLNREGYDDRGTAMLASLRAAGAEEVISSSRDFVCLSLNPARRPTLPPVFAEGWFDLEVDTDGTRRLCSGDGSLRLYNHDKSPRTARLLFGIQAFSPREVTISAGEQGLYQALIDPGEPPRQLDLEVELAPGVNEIKFASDRPGELLGNGDPRPLGFAIFNFAVLP